MRIESTDTKEMLKHLRGRYTSGASGIPETLYYSRPGQGQRELTKTANITAVRFYGKGSDPITPESPDTAISLAYISIPGGGLIWVNPAHESVVLRDSDWANRDRLRGVEIGHSS